MKITNRGTYNIKKCTINGSEIVEVFTGEFRDAKTRAVELQKEFTDKQEELFKEKLGKDYKNQKKRKALGTLEEVQFTATIKLN